MTSAPPPALVGQTLGPYRLLELIGLGGMGEVYKAHDQRLDRTVAVKVLPRSFVASQERVLRFEREARAASAINHPHIAAIHDVGCDKGLHFIAMEYVEGQSMSAWLARDGLTLAELLLVMEQVADALARAHEAGVLHRDVKPANVIVARNGYAKLLDFGLAKITGDSGDEGSDVSSRLSRSGVLLGTLAYMSPEQTRGQKLDRRSDIFSFGIMLYEAVAGRPPFAGESGIEAVSAVLRDDPIPRLRDHPGVPAELVRVIGKALEKEPARRYQYLDDLLVDLRAVRRAVEAGGVETADELDAGSRWLFGAVGLFLGVLGGWLAWRGLGQPAAPPPVLRAGLTLRSLTQGGGLNRGPAIAPSGDLVTYASDREGSFDLMVQQVGSGRPLRVTDDPGDELTPAFSPDGQTLAFATGDGRIEIIPALGGQRRTLAQGGADAPAWSPDGERILYRSGGGLSSVSRSGGPPTRLLEDRSFPVLERAAWSPDGRWIVFPSVSDGRYALLRVPAQGGRPRPIEGSVQALGSPVFGADGRWIFGTTGPPRQMSSEILAAPLGRDASLGAPERVLGGVLRYLHPSVSRDQRRIVFEVQDLALSLGRQPLLAREPRLPDRLTVDSRFFDAQVSPAGDALALVSDRGGGPELWRMSVGAGDWTRLREGLGTAEQPAWSPDGRFVAFTHVAGSRRRIAIVPAGGGETRFVSGLDSYAGYPAWSPDARSLAYVTLDVDGPAIRVAPAAGGAARVVAKTSRGLERIAWSPDGRSIAASLLAERGGMSLGVAPAAGGELRVVLENARAPLWLGDGRLVFARETRPAHLDLWSVSMDAAAAPVPGSERRLTALPRGQGIDGERGASTDGRFLYVTVVQHLAGDVWLGEAR